MENIITVCGIAILSTKIGETEIAVRNCDVPLPLGHEFRNAVTWERGKPGETITERNIRYSQPAVIVTHNPVHLRVTKIRWCGRDVEELDPGHTAVLTIQGEGIEHIKTDGGLR